MEAIAAIASIIQIAQLGAQLSITLYKVADTVGSANKDVQYVAKDIALFSAVLKDLGKTLGKGQKSRLYREDAYKTSLLIVKECEDVFGEIEEVLKKNSRDGAPLDADIPLPRIEKFLWIFKKSRVQLLRGNLESLKSTITLQLAVLNYADRVSSPLADDLDNADELLTLKSLVLANETAKRDFNDLLSKSIQDSPFEPANPRATSTNTVNGTQGNARGDPHVPASSNSNLLYAVAMTSKPSSTVLENTSQGTSASKSTLSNSVSFNPSELTTRYAQIWGLLDRLEFALRKVELARWEHERIQENLLSEFEDRPSDEREEARFLQRLERDLSKFGLSNEKVNQAIASLKVHSAGATMRAEVTHVVSKNEQLFGILHSLGASWDIHENPDCCVVKRWIPGYLEDILWEHTCQLLSTQSNEGLDQTVDHAMKDTMSTPRSNTRSAPSGGTANKMPFLSFREPLDLDQSIDAAPTSTPTSTYSRGLGEGPPRKSHTKSRKGCKICKREHIRCDEQFPQCRNCTNRKIRCDYLDIQPAPRNQALLSNYTDVVSPVIRTSSDYGGSTTALPGVKAPMMDDRLGTSRTSGSPVLSEQKSPGRNVSNTTYPKDRTIPSIKALVGPRESAFNTIDQTIDEESRLQPVLTLNSSEQSFEGAASVQKRVYMPRGLRDAQWTKIDRKLISPEVLEDANEKFETRDDYVIVLRVLTRDEIEHYAMRTKMKEIKRSRYDQRSSTSAENNIWSGKERLESVEDKPYSERLSGLSSVTRKQDDVRRYPQTVDTLSPCGHGEKHGVNKISVDRSKVEADQNVSDKAKEAKYYLDAPSIKRNMDVGDLKISYGGFYHLGGQERLPNFRERRESLGGKTEIPIAATRRMGFSGTQASPIPPNSSTADGESQLTTKAPDKTGNVAMVEEDKISERRNKEESMVKATKEKSDVYDNKRRVVEKATAAKAKTELEIKRRGVEESARRATEEETKKSIEEAAVRLKAEVAAEKVKEEVNAEKREKAPVPRRPARVSLGFLKKTRKSLKPKVVTDGPVVRESRKPDIVGEVKDPNDKERLYKSKTRTESLIIKAPERVIGNESAASEGGLLHHQLSAPNITAEPKPSLILSTAKDKGASKLALADFLKDTSMGSWADEMEDVPVPDSTRSDSKPPRPVSVESEHGVSGHKFSGKLEQDGGRSSRIHQPWRKTVLEGKTERGSETAEGIKGEDTDLIALPQVRVDNINHPNKSRSTRSNDNKSSLSRDGSYTSYISPPILSLQPSSQLTLLPKSPQRASWTPILPLNSLDEGDDGQDPGWRWFDPESKTGFDESELSEARDPDRGNEKGKRREGTREELIPKAINGELDDKGEDVVILSSFRRFERVEDLEEHRETNVRSPSMQGLAPLGMKIPTPLFEERYYMSQGAASYSRTPGTLEENVALTTDVPSTTDRLQAPPQLLPRSVKIYTSISNPEGHESTAQYDQVQGSSERDRTQRQREETAPTGTSGSRAGARSSPLQSNGSTENDLEPLAKMPAMIQMSARMEMPAMMEMPATMDMPAMEMPELDKLENKEIQSKELEYKELEYKEDVDPSQAVMWVPEIELPALDAAEPVETDALKIGGAKIDPPSPENVDFSDSDLCMGEAPKTPPLSDQSTGERKPWFATDGDKTSQKVEELLRKWTFLDER